MLFTTLVAYTANKTASSRDMYLVHRTTIVLESYDHCH